MIGANAALHTIDNLLAAKKIYSRPRALTVKEVWAEYLFIEYLLCELLKSHWYWSEDLNTEMIYVISTVFFFNLRKN